MFSYFIKKWNIISLHFYKKYRCLQAEVIHKAANKLTSFLIIIQENEQNYFMSQANHNNTHRNYHNQKILKNKQ